MLDAGLTVAAVTALVLGFVVHRWRFLVALAGAGIITIVVDVSTRNLTSGGHDDRGLVAIAEAVMLTGLVALFAFGVMLRKWRDRDNRRASIGGGTRELSSD